MYSVFFCLGLASRCLNFNLTIVSACVNFKQLMNRLYAIFAESWLWTTVLHTKHNSIIFSTCMDTSDLMTWMASLSYSQRHQSIVGSSEILIKSLSVEEFRQNSDRSEKPQVTVRLINDLPPGTQYQESHQSQHPKIECNINWYNW